MFRGERMEILGALKKSNSQGTVLFYKYDDADFDWNEMIFFFQKCRLMQDLSSDDIYCVAVSKRETNSEIVGVVFQNETGYVNVISKEYADLEWYLHEIAEVSGA